MRTNYIVLLLLSLILSNTTLAEDLPAPKKITENTYAWIGPYGPPTKKNHGFRMNMGFVVGKKAVAVIDSGYSDDMARSMLKHIRQITKRPVRYVINTNSQPHRILGNTVFKNQGAKLIASADAIPRLVKEGVAMARIAEERLGLAKGRIHSPAIADRQIKQTIQLDLGGVKLNVIPAGHAHTAGCVIVDVVQDNVVFAGDILYNGRLLAILPLSNVEHWIGAYDSLRKFKGALFIPGHGQPAKLSGFEHSTYEYLTKLKTHMDEAIKQGLDLNDALRMLDQSPWQKLENFDQLAGRNAHQTYLEREAASFE